ncbi:HyaD/HybD family hydrogenase maturation endopeptidase [Desulfocurvus sp.]|uniref:HyaD/HybD family hydrogenase maturation endopeptidase n=1 Tax=Desulfocurvus sp. TaxID=2871698 RepID=UPI0025C320CA|nr:HyaD/HybD family hydrogenase maturation endopeptidase [Desulfocurvus sp.]MCK9239152.1 HyaD/HybD family hydrogenase maturation endopeptidase [Desulfocurvus sp.]
MADEKKSILVLGVGNILLRDEGVGVRVVERLGREFAFSDNVRLMDGGVRGMILMDPIIESDHVVIIDAVVNDHPPGTIYRLDGDDLRLSVAFKNSVHDMDLLETMCCCELISGKRPSAVIVGIEPKDYQSDPLVELSPEIEAKIPRLMELALEEIRAVGGDFAPRSDN